MPRIRGSGHPSTGKETVMQVVRVSLASGVLAVLSLAVGGQGQEKTPYQPPKDYKDFDLKVLGVGFVEPKKDDKTGFVVGGKNDTALIRKLAEINGRPIADLETAMRPGAQGEEGSV